MATLKELNAKKKELKSTLKRLEGSGASKQQIGRVQYKLNQVMKEKPDRRITKRKTPLADRGPSSGTGKKKAGPDMYKDAVALDKTKGKGKVTVTGLNGKSRKVKAGSADKVITPVQKKNDKGLEKPKPSRMVRKGKGHPSAEMFAYVQNIDKKPSVKKKK